MTIADFCTITPVAAPRNCEEVALNWIKLNELSDLVCTGEIFSALNKVNEEFNGLTSGNTVTIGMTPLAGYDVTVYRNGVKQQAVTYTVTVLDYIFNVAFGNSANGIGGENISIEYFTNL